MFVEHDVINCKDKAFIVIKLNPKKVKCVMLSSGETWNIPYHMATFIRKATSTDLALLQDANMYKAQKDGTALTALKAGQVVRCTLPKLKNKLWVVTAINKTTDTVVPFQNTGVGYRVSKGTCVAVSNQEIITELLK